MIYIWSKLPAVIPSHTATGHFRIKHGNNPIEKIPFTQIQVKDIYNLLTATITLPILKPRRNTILTDWEANWSYLNNAQFLSPTDKQFLHKTWNMKLWTYKNRKIADKDPVCPLCQLQEEYYNHPLSSNCLYANNLFCRIQETWYHWTNTNITATMWNTLCLTETNDYKDLLLFAIIIAPENAIPQIHISFTQHNN